MQALKKTPLNEEHRSLKAKMVPFGGWDMPVQYTSIINEHIATREKAGLFDVSHMGEIFIEGNREDVLEFLEKNTCNSVEPLAPFAVQYNAVLNEKGGLVDDITLYKFDDTRYMICSNASNYEKVYEHLLKQSGSQKLSIRNESENWHQLAIQGPLSETILAQVLNADLSGIKYYRFAMVPFHGEDLIISRTGYTGEDGFEIYTSIPVGIDLWKKLLVVGIPNGLVPVGLGARDTLRLEAKYPLYGHELNAERTPVESGIGWIVKEKKVQFHDYERIIHQKKNGASHNIVGIQLAEPGVLRENYSITDKNGNSIGVVTSGTYSPSRKDSVGLAYLSKESIVDGNEIWVDIRGSKKKAIVHTKSFITSKVKK